MASQKSIPKQENRNKKQRGDGTNRKQKVTEMKEKYYNRSYRH